VRAGNFARRVGDGRRAYNAGMGHSKIVLARTCSSRPEADLAKGVLEAEGIPVLSQADNAGGMREHLAWSGAGFQIFVREEDLGAARELLAELENAVVREDEAKFEDDSLSEPED
jgi:hypothetical protein